MSNKKGQASVEYLLMIVVVTSLVLGLVSFSGVIENKVAAWKFGARNKLAGMEDGTDTYDLSRTDFKMGPAPEAKADGGGGGGAAASGGGRKGKKRAGAGGEGEGGEMTGMGVTAPGAGAQRGASGEGEGTSEAARPYSTDETVRQTPSPDTGYATEAERGEGAQGEKAGEEGAAGTEAEGEEGAKSSLLKRQQGLGMEREKTLAERDWSIGKFLIILAIVFFFIIIVLKARQAKN